MQNSGSTNSLAERMRAKAEQDRLEVESLTREQFENLRSSLSESSKNALNTTENVILGQLANLEKNVSSHCHLLSVAFGWKCLQAAAITVSVLMGAVLGGWSLFTLAGNKALGLHQEIATLTAQRGSLQAENANLWSTFKGLEPYQAGGKNYLLTPEGWTINRSGTLGKQDAWQIVRK